MKLRKPLALLASWALVLLALLRFVPDLVDVVEPRTLLFVVGIPLVFAIALLGARDVATALRDGVIGDADALPPGGRARSTGVLRLLGDLSAAAGVFAFFATVIATFNAIAQSGGQGNPMELLGGASTTFLAPLYGFLLRAFVYGPLASGLEEPGSWLGGDLD